MVIVPYQTRRTFLKVSGAVLGGIAAGTTVVAAESADRFIVDSTNLDGYGDLEVLRELGQVDLAVVRGDESDVEALGATYARDLLYRLDRPADGQLHRRYEEPKGRRGRESATDEPFYAAYQWDKQALDVPSAHEITRGEGTRVAIIDSGIGAGHPDLEHAVNLELSRSFVQPEDDYGVGEPYGGYHGTHVSGIVAADDRNEAGIVGTAPATELVDLRVFSPLYGGAFFADILGAMVYAGAIDSDAANLSLGAYPIPRQGLGSFYGRSLNRVMTYVNAQGTALCIAAGNDAADLQHDGSFISLPNEGAQALSISATGPVGYRWDATEVGDEEHPAESPAIYTNFGTNAIDLGAPGGDVAPSIYAKLVGEDDGPIPDVPWHLDLVFSTVAEPQFSASGKYLGADFGYGWAAGTSMAAPQVAGAVALVRSEHPTWGSDKVESALERAASVPDDYDKTFYGSGFLNLVDAL